MQNASYLQAYYKVNEFQGAILHTAERDNEDNFADITGPPLLLNVRNLQAWLYGVIDSNQDMRLEFKKYYTEKQEAGFKRHLRERKGE